MRGSQRPGTQSQSSPVQTEVELAQEGGRGGELLQTYLIRLDRRKRITGVQFVTDILCPRGHRAGRHGRRERGHGQLGVCGKRRKRTRHGGASLQANIPTGDGRSVNKASQRTRGTGHISHLATMRRDCGVKRASVRREPARGGGWVRGRRGSEFFLRPGAGGEHAYLLGRAKTAPSMRESWRSDMMP